MDLFLFWHGLLLRVSLSCLLVMEGTGSGVEIIFVKTLKTSIVISVAN